MTSVFSPCMIKCLKLYAYVELGTLANFRFVKFVYFLFLCLSVFCHGSFAKKWNTKRKSYTCILVELFVFPIYFLFPCNKIQKTWYQYPVVNNKILSREPQRWTQVSVLVLSTTWFRCNLNLVVWMDLIWI